jgi:hypothetical protein
MRALSPSTRPFPSTVSQCANASDSSLVVLLFCFHTKTADDDNASDFLSSGVAKYTQKWRHESNMQSTPNP